MPGVLDAEEAADARAAAVVVDDPLVLAEARDEIRVEMEDAAAGETAPTRTDRSAGRPA